MQQVITKRLGLHHATEIARGGGDHAHINGHLLGAPDAEEASGLERPQQLALQLEIEVADVIEVERAAGREFEESELALLCARIGSLLHTKEFELESRFLKAGAIDGNERPRRPASLGVQEPRHQVLAGAGLAGDEHG